MVLWLSPPNMICKSIAFVIIFLTEKPTNQLNLFGNNNKTSSSAVADKLCDASYYYCYYYKLMSWIIVLPSHSCGGTLQNLDIQQLHSSMQTSADDRSRQRHVSHMTDEKVRLGLPPECQK